MRKTFLGGALLGMAWAALKSPPLQRLDVKAGDTLRRAGSPPLDSVVTHTTDLGSVYAVTGIAAVLAATGRRRPATDVLVTGMLAWVVGQGSKTRVRRQRPYEAHGVRRLIRPPTGSSFPSGHATVAAAVGTVLAGHARPGAGRLLAGLLGPYVAASRVYVGVHYPTDVVGGTGLGMMVASLWLSVRDRRSRNGDVAVPAAEDLTVTIAPPLPVPRTRSAG